MSRFLFLIFSSPRSAASFLTVVNEKKLYLPANRPLVFSRSAKTNKKYHTLRLIFEKVVFAHVIPFCVIASALITPFCPFEYNRPHSSIPTQNVNSNWKNCMGVLYEISCGVEMGFNDERENFKVVMSLKLRSILTVSFCLRSSVCGLCCSCNPSTFFVRMSLLKRTKPSLRRVSRSVDHAPNFMLKVQIELYTLALRKLNSHLSFDYYSIIDFLI